MEVQEVHRETGVPLKEGFWHRIVSFLLELVFWAT